LSFALPQAAAQQNTPPIGHSYINPFPTGDRYRIVVLGDSLGQGVWEGLYRAFDEDKNLEFVNKAKPGMGFARTTAEEWTKDLDDILKSDTYQIAVVMFGGFPYQDIRSGKDRLKVGTDAWREVFGKRVEAFVKKLREANIAVYWVGLPIMRSADQNTQAEALNDLFREKAFINGAKFVETWNGFTDDAGRYSAYGPDMSGQVKRLRADDGVHLTMRGYLKLAHFVEKQLRPDLTAAKRERNIPLAGNEEEQTKVIGRGFATEPAEPDGQPAADAGADSTTELQESSVGEVSVVRPAMDQTLQAAQSLAPQGGSVTGPQSEMITSEIENGLTAVATISSLTDPSLASSRPRLPLAERPYYRVLIKGEQPKPKSGRGDDFAWPPS
jgi:uncharacterized protein